MAISHFYKTKEKVVELWGMGADGCSGKASRWSFTVIFKVFCPLHWGVCLTLRVFWEGIEKWLDEEKKSNVAM